MLDASGDLAALLDDCGQAADTKNGPLLGRFVEDPIETETLSGKIALSSEPVFYAQQSEIDSLALVRDDWIQIGARKWFVKDLPRADTTGLVRITLKR